MPTKISARAVVIGAFLIFPCAYVCMFIGALLGISDNWGIAAEIIPGIIFAGYLTGLISKTSERLNASVAGMVVLVPAIFREVFQTSSIPERIDLYLLQKLVLATGVVLLMSLGGAICGWSRAKSRNVAP